MQSSNEKLKVGGLVPLTTNDLPSQLSAVIFCQGCPWRCRYCHNPHLIAREADNNLVWEEVVRFLKERVGLLDSVVFSGGEPTMQRALPKAIKEVMNLGYKLGLHTAGQFPRTLEEILPDMHWIGMDFKAPPEKYREITGRDLRWGSIVESAEMIIASGSEYEFRTTYHPKLLSEKDLLRIASLLSDLGCQHYVLQGFRAQGCQDSELTDFEQCPMISKKLFCELKSMFEQFSLRSFSEAMPLIDYFV